MAAFFLLAAAIACLCWRYRDKLKSKKITILVLIMLCAIIAQNVALIISYNSKQRVDRQFYKEDFNITQTAEGQPNIYWIHCDGMLGFDSMSRFFGDDQEEFTGELESRGFWISREATFDGNQATTWAVSMLMSPFYYDRVLSWAFDLDYAKSLSQNEDLLNNPSLRLPPNDASNKYANQKNETITAFKLAGYNTCTISDGVLVFQLMVDNYYLKDNLLISTRPDSGGDSIEELGLELETLLDLFLHLTPLPESMLDLLDMKSSYGKITSENYKITSFDNNAVDLFSEWEEDDARRAYLKNYNLQASALYDTFDLSEPRFTVYNYFMPHMPFAFDEEGNYTTGDYNNPMRYPAQHTFSAKSLLKFIDLILEHDPDAVIVLQADHGLHGLPRTIYWGMKKTLETFSCTPEEAAGLWNQVMSAVRLPAEQITAETEQILSGPRNISRYLINTYVGENYDYIPNQYRQTLEALYNRDGQAAD